MKKSATVLLPPSDELWDTVAWQWYAGAFARLVRIRTKSLSSAAGWHGRTRPRPLGDAAWIISLGSMRSPVATADAALAVSSPSL
jgi:hypothetical protein